MIMWAEPVGGLVEAARLVWYIGGVIDPTYSWLRFYEPVGGLVEAARLVWYIGGVIDPTYS